MATNSRRANGEALRGAAAGRPWAAARPHSLCWLRVCRAGGRLTDELRAGALELVLGAGAGSCFLLALGGRCCLLAAAPRRLLAARSAHHAAAAGPASTAAAGLLAAAAAAAGPAWLLVAPEARRWCLVPQSRRGQRGLRACLHVSCPCPRSRSSSDKLRRETA